MSINIRKLVVICFTLIGSMAMARDSLPVAILDQHLESVSSVINKETQATELVEPMLDATKFELSFEGLLSVNPSVLIIMQAEREKGSSTIDQLLDN